MNNLKKMIKKSGLKQSHIASKVGISDNTLTSYITGKRNPSIEKAKKLADFFNCKIEDIFFVENKHNKNKVVNNK
jgi:DNA-binding XRE family transcriptional regulator